MSNIQNLYKTTRHFTVYKRDGVTSTPYPMDKWAFVDATGTERTFATRVAARAAAHQLRVRHAAMSEPDE